MCSAEDELDDLECEVSNLRKKLRGGNPEAVDLICEAIEDVGRGLLTFEEMRQRAQTIRDLNERGRLDKLDRVMA